MNRDGKIKLYLFIFFAAFYLLSSGDHYTDVNYSTDELIMMVSTYALVEGGSFTFQEIYGQTASKYGIGQTLAAVPFFVLGKTVARFFPDERNDIIVGYSLYATNAVIAALLIIAFYAFSRYLRYPPKTAFYSSMVLGLCTICFPYARMFFMHPLTALLLLLLVFYLTKYARRKRTKDVFLTGLLFALLLLTRIDTIVIMMVIIPAFILIGCTPHNFSRKYCLGKYLKDAFILIIPITISLTAHLIINHLKFGSLKQSGYEGEGFTTTFSFGLYGLLFSPARSIFLYSPPLILCIAGLKRFFARRPLLATIIISVAIIEIFFFAKWHDWHGGLSWGPRYLLPLVPLCMLFINEIFLRFQKYSKFIRSLIILSVLAGLIVQMIGVLTSFSQFNGNIYSMVNEDENQFLFIPQLSGIAGNLHFIRLGMIDSFIINFTQYFPPILLIIVITIFTAGILFSLVNLKRLIEFRLSDFIIIKRFAEWTRCDKAFIILAALNIILFIAIQMIISSNAIPRKTQISYSGGRKEEWLSRDILTCIDESVPNIESGIENIHLNWTGIFRAPLSGDYTFYVKVLGKYLLQIDNKPIMGLTEFKGQITFVKKLHLDQGYHDFQMQYQPSDPKRRLLHLYATFPGFGHYKTMLSNKHIFSHEPSAFLRSALFLDQFKVAFVIVSILILLFLSIWGEKRERHDQF